MLNFFRKITPRFLKQAYHWFLARVAALFYFFPSNKLIVIGVTGTNGKTTTVNLISQILEALGEKVFLSSTVNFKLGKKEWLNNKKMTMLGRFATQKLLRQAVKENCRFAIIESSSQGIDQFRHLGINYDLVVFTNLTPEHIEAHGGFENYRAAKEKLFKHLSNSRRKIVFGKKINKIIISNADDSETERLKKYSVDQFVTYGFQNSADFQAKNLILESGLVSFELGQEKIKTKLLGKFNAYNILASIVAVKNLGFSETEILKTSFQGVPGRQELIENNKGFQVMVDYAPEPESLKQLYQALKNLNYHKLIHVLGSCGGGRDRARQPILGEMAGQFADIVVVTNEDPYDDDPQEIMTNVSAGAIKAGKEANKNLYEVLDRKQAIIKALSLAKSGDLVLITGKGAEQFICGRNGQKILHDDRQVVREYFQRIK
ncbi:UDP-N-acetylmuramoyl-L-alanyl-D-glutamate--2,6-diaminopimelate ligase [Candidatus Nomurabacteria bacterium]|nr:UDP-N-acetylmuramoyl-L-alanyl-D-glutamate--2,6-diaminopimelate ligase [Candidatus Nomurabacteria bacterium]